MTRHAKCWCSLIAATLLTLAASAVFASYHTFRIERIYSNVDGTVQFIVLRESAGVNGESFWRGKTLTSSRAGQTQEYIFPSDLPGGMDDDYGYGYGRMPSPTANKRVLIASEGFAALGLVLPDYVIPNGFLPIDGGTLNFAGVDQVTYSALPTDGVHAINASGAVIQNVATNFAGASASVVPTTSPPPIPNFQGLFYNAPAESEAGWGINFAHQGDVIFATWFVYDATGRAWWLTMTAEKTGPNTYTGKLYETRGPALNTVPFNPTAVQALEVGNGTLTFPDANNGTFRYTVNGITQTKTLVRQVFGTVLGCAWGAQSNLALAANFQDLWWAAPPPGVESGWGVNFTHQGDIIFVTWFTYDFDGKPLWLSATAHKSAAGVYTGAVFRTTGPAFSAMPWDKSMVTVTQVGDLTITFANGNSASFHYTLTLGTPPVVIDQTKQIVRQVFRTPGTVCQ
jgi:hypothetical protein